MTETMMLAPIVLFVYNRIWHTQQTIETLQKNELAEKSELYIYSDAAKTDRDIDSVKEVRNYIRQVDGFKTVTIIEREKNWGLAASIIDGVTSIVNQYGKVIVLEDDIVTSPDFLSFMNEALELYQDEEKVYSITGYSFTDDIDQMESSYFLKLTSSWSWATWSNRWQIFSSKKEELEKIVNAPNSEKYLFDYDGSYNYIEMAKLQLAGKIDSWAIYWYLSVFKQDGLTLYPQKKLVKNIGFDGSGTHCSTTEKKENLDFFYPTFTTEMEEKEQNRNIVANILKQKNKINLKNKILSLIRNNLSADHKQYLSILFSKAKLLFYKKDIGIDSYVDRSANVFGWEHVSIGSNTLVSEQTWLNVNGRIKDFKHIKIGDYCYIGRRNLLSASKELIIGDYVMTNNDCKFYGSNHVYSNPLNPYIATGTTNEDILKVGTNVWIGGGAIILGAVIIGHGSIIGAGSVVTKNIPPFSIAVGNPCKVIKRFDFETLKWTNVEDFDLSLEKLMPNEMDYLEILKSNKPYISMPIMAATSRYGDLM